MREILIPMELIIFASIPITILLIVYIEYKFNFDNRLFNFLNKRFMKSQNKQEKKK